MTEQPDNVYNCDDKSLGSMLARLFAEGAGEVVVRHPLEGDIVVTEADYKKHLANIKKAMDMSPADRIKAKQRLKNVKNQKLIRFRTALIGAEVHQVDFENSEFGVDIEGNKMDLDNMVFVRVEEYPKGTKLLDNEVGAFFSEKELKPPIRITGIISGNEG